VTPADDPSSPVGDIDAFPHSIASFDPTDASVLLWARTEVGDRVRWTVAHDAELTDVVASGEVAVDLDRDHTAVVTVDELQSATEYHFAFEVEGRRSTVGRTRTLPAGPTERARLAVVSCANLARAPLTVYRAMAAIPDLDVVVHLGDYIYEDDGAKGDIPVDPPRYLVTLDDYRRRYRQARADADLQALHERYPFVTIWDDHDVADNTWDDGAKSHDDEEMGPWPDRLAAATRARQEWLPIRLRDPDDEGLLWRSFALGDLAELVMLDTRLGGRDEALDSAGEGIDDPSRAILSPEQWEWATERIVDRSRRWSLVASQVPVSEMHLPMPDGLNLDRFLPEGYTVQDGIGVCTDQWDGYAAEQQRLSRVLGERGGGAVILSADVHSSWVFDGPFGPDGEPVAGELTGSSVSSTTMGGNLGRAGTKLGQHIAEHMDHVCWVDLHEHGFLVVDVTAERLRGEVWAVDPADGRARAQRLTAWDIGPGPGARWVETTAEDGGVDAEGDSDTTQKEPTADSQASIDDDVVQGPPAHGPRGADQQRPARPIALRVLKAALVAGAVIGLRPFLRAARQGAGAARSRR